MLKKRQNFKIILPYSDGFPGFELTFINKCAEYVDWFGTAVEIAYWNYLYWKSSISRRVFFSNGLSLWFLVADPQ